MSAEADPYCDFGGLPRSMCAHCRGYRAPEITAEQAASYARYRYGGERHTPAAVRWAAALGHAVAEKPFTAAWFELLWIRHLAALDNGITIQSRWRGRCRGCDREWDEGDDITWSDDESAWVCGGCARPG